jgi:hypothetical protein
MYLFQVPLPGKSYSFPRSMGISLLVTLIIIPQVAPPPLPLDVCLKGHNVDTFSIHPTVEVLVDGKLKQLPSGIGNETVDGKDCLRPIHTDAQGNIIISGVFFDSCLACCLSKP